MPEWDLEWRYPNLRREGYIITSPPVRDYNCVAWAAGENKRWFEASDEPGHYWPDGVQTDGSLSAYVALFVHYGFELCESGVWEQGYEKVALYATEEGDFTHVSRSTLTGKWTSKCGKLDDIEHNTLVALEGDRYGSPARFLRRPVSKRRMYDV